MIVNRRVWRDGYSSRPHISTLPYRLHPVFDNAAPRILHEFHPTKLELRRRVAMLLALLREFVLRYQRHHMV